MHKDLRHSADEIKQKVPFNELFRELYPENDTDNGKADCPWCNEHSFTIRDRGGLCSGSCAKNGKPHFYDVIALWQRNAGCDFKGAIKTLRQRCKPDTSPEPASELNLADAYIFVDALAGENQPIMWQWFDDQKKGRVIPDWQYGTLQEMEPKLTELNLKGAGIYVMVNRGDGQGRSNPNVTAVRAIFLDLDGNPLEPVLEWEFKPHIVTQTSRGHYQCFWLVDGFPLDKALYTAVQTAICAKFDGDYKVTKDLCRVMRVAGFLHQKGEPFLSTLEECNNHLPYQANDLIAALGVNRDKPAENVPPSDHVAGVVDVISEPGRNDAFISLAGKLRKMGLELDELEPALQAMNKRRCNPPMSPSEVHGIAKSAAKYPAGNFITSATVMGEEISFYDLMNRDIPEPKWIVDELLPPGLGILVGQPKVGKSWLAQHISIAIASGQLALGMFRVDQGDVLHLALEDTPQRFKHRMIRMLPETEAPRSAIFRNTCPALSDNSKEVGALDVLHHWLEKHTDTARLIVVDTLTKIRPRRRGRESAYDSDYKDLAPLQQLAGLYGVAILLIHHQRKEKSEDQFDTVSGSTAITGAADTVWILEKSARGETDGTLFISGRDLDERTGALTFDKLTGLWRWIGSAAEATMSRTRLEIREVLREAAGKSLTPKEIADQSGQKPGNIRTTLTRMLEAGEVEKPAGQSGRYVLPPGEHRYAKAPVTL